MYNMRTFVTTRTFCSSASVSACFELLIKNRSIQTQPSTQHDVLLDKKTLLAPVKRSTSDLLALVADGGVWVESVLFLPAFRRLDIGGVLRVRGVVL
jgi:hypothetical protein